MTRSGLAVLAALALAGLTAPAALAQVPAAQVALMEGDATSDYRALGAVSVTVHQKSMFPKTPVSQQIDAALRAEAAKLGADAVIQVKYDMANAMTSRDGHKATGVAVRFTRTATAAAVPAPAAPVAVTPPALAAAPAMSAAAPSVLPAAPSPPAPAAVVASAPAVVASPPVVAVPAIVPAPPAAVAPAPTTPAAITASRPRRAANAAEVLLAEQDIPGQRYVRLGEVSAVTHQRSMFPKEPPRVTLQNALRAEAHKLGADAVIMVKYDMGNAMTTRDGNKATGVAVRYE